MREGRYVVDMMIMNLFEGKEDLPVLKPETLEVFRSMAVVKRYGKGELLFCEREENRALFLLIEGHVAICKINKNHDRKVIFMCHKGELLNEEVMQSHIASTSCVAMDDVIAMRLPYLKLGELINIDMDFERYVFMSAVKKLRRCYRQLGNSMNTVLLEQQVASKLWKLAKDYGREEEDMVRIPFELSITFMADIVGSRRETVSRIVKRLSERGLINFSGGTMYVRDMDGLRCYASNRG